MQRLEARETLVLSRANARLASLMTAETQINGDIEIIAINTVNTKKIRIASLASSRTLLAKLQCRIFPKPKWAYGITLPIRVE